jgi:DNA repair exonuclease SbcCD nuclease subunit
MKIIHISDLHLSSPLTARLSSEKQRERKAELFDTFRRIVRRGEELGARAIIIAGDLFDNRRIPKRQLERAISVIEEAASITFLYLPGNHEGEALTESGLALPENIRIFGEEWTYFEIDNVRFAGRSTLPVNLGDGLTLDREKVNIAVLHGALGVHGDGDEIIGGAELAGRGINYLALGHFHTYAVSSLSDGCPAVYCGTPEGRGFDEVGDCGFVLIDTDGARLDFRFYPIAKRRMRWVKVDISGCEGQSELKARVRSATEDIPSSDLVRVELIGNRPVELIPDLDTLAAAIGGRFYYLDAIRDSSRAEINPEKYRYDKTLKGEFIRLVSADESLSEEEKELIIRCGVTALMGEDVVI